MNVIDTFNPSFVNGIVVCELFLGEKKKTTINKTRFGIGVFFFFFTNQDPENQYYYHKHHNKVFHLYI